MSQGAKKTHQDRSRQTRDKLLNALENLLKKQDFAEISVAQIASAAGVSPASIYRRFDGKNGFIPVLFELYLQRLEEWSHSADARLELEDDCPLREALYRIALTGWRQICSQAHIMRAVHMHGRNHLGLMNGKDSAFEEATLETVRMLVDMFGAEIKRTDKDKTARMLAYYLNSIMIEKGLFGDKGAIFGIAFGDETFAKEIADFAYGYLTTPD